MNNKLLFFALGVLLILVLTNPSLSEYTGWSASKAPAGYTKSVFEARAARSNFLFFSIFKYRRFKTLGIAGQFIELNYPNVTWMINRLKRKLLSPEENNNYHQDEDNPHKLELD